MDLYRDRSLVRFAQDLAAHTPTPGGGSASALIGALACALAEMVARFSLAKAEGEAQATLEGAVERFAGWRARLLELVDEDCASYEAVRAARRLPKETEEQKRARREAIDRATRGAMAAPLQGMRLVAEAVEELGRIAGRVRPALSSDLCCAAEAARAALEGLAHNVAVNAESLPGDDEAERALSEARQHRSRVASRIAEVLAAAGSAS